MHLDRQERVEIGFEPAPVDGRPCFYCTIARCCPKIGRSGGRAKPGALVCNASVFNRSLSFDIAATQICARDKRWGHRYPRGLAGRLCY